MLVLAKPGADSSKGCALPVIARRLLATHPHRFAIREMPLGDTP
jgi:hypothetical protein